jgi:hypothetical protein
VREHRTCRRASPAREGEDLQNAACRSRSTPPMLQGYLSFSERDAVAIRTAFDQGSELSAAVELRWLYPGKCVGLVAP